jgi:hypothetical protein
MAGSLCGEKMVVVGGSVLGITVRIVSVTHFAKRKMRRII